MKRKCVDSYKGPFTVGTDLSVYQRTVAWNEVLKDPQKISYAIVRTGDGRGADKTFVAKVKGARSLLGACLVDGGPLPLGSYHYVRADRDGKTQAQLVARLWDEAGGFKRGIDLPPAIDIEGGARKDLPGGNFEPPPGIPGGGLIPIDLFVDECLEFQAEIERVFRVRPLVYTGQAFHWWLSQGRPDLAKLFAPYPLWLASYASCAYMPVDRKGKGYPWKRWSLWQYTSEGVIRGVKGKVDLNRFRGTLAELRKFCASSKI